MLRKLLVTSNSFAPLIVRLGLAVVFVAHGSQKVLGVYGGSGFRNFISGNTPFAFMRPAWLWLSAAALSELVGGLLVGFGFLTRLGAFLLLCVMLTAIIGVHWPNFFSSSRGFEYPLALLAMSLSLIISGAGAVSVDKAMSGGGGGRRR